MKTFFTVLVLLIFTNVKAQTPSWEWARMGNGNGEGYSVATDDSKNVYFTGGYTDTIAFGTHVLIDTFPQPYLVKYDSLGNVLWAKSSCECALIHPGPYGGYGNKLNVDPFGNVLMTGWFRDGTITFDTSTIYSQSATSLFIAKFDSSGKVLWLRGAGGSYDQYATGLATDSIGNIYVSGYFSGPQIIFGTDTLINTSTSSSDDNIFIAKYNSSGNLIWAKREGGASWSTDLSVDRNGYIYIVGEFSSPTISFGSTTLTNSNSGSSSYLIAKYDSSGIIQWAQTVSGWLYGNAITTTSLNEIYVTGIFLSPSAVFGSTTLFNTGSRANYIVKYNSSGNIVWALGSSSSAYCDTYNVKVDSQDNPYLIGGFGFPGNTFYPVTFDTITLPPPLGTDPLFIFKFDSSGHAIWALGLGSGGDDQNSIAIDKTGDIYIGSDFQMTPFVVGNDTLIYSIGFENPFVAKITAPTSTGIHEINNSIESIVYPNPFTNNITIKVNSNELSQITLYDLQSRKILQQNFSSSTILNTEQLSPGVYIYELKNKNRIIKNGKVIKQ